MRQRAITAGFFVLAMLGGIYGGFWPFVILFGVITTGSLWEFFKMTIPNDGDFPAVRRAVTTAVAAFPYWYIALNPVQADLQPVVMQLFFGVLAGMTILGLCAQLFFGAEHPYANLGQAVLGVLYITLPFVLLIDIAVEPTQQVMPNRIMGLLLLTWTNDTLAYVIGSRIGKYKLMPRISPKKTWEGTVGGALCTILIAYALGAWVFPEAFTTQQWLAMGIVTAIFATVGDLVESMLKRSADVKDSGNLLPGHGGLLDRFDAFIFVLPIAWVVLRLMAV